MKKYFIAAMFASLPFAYGVHAIWTEKIALVGRHNTTYLYGDGAIWAGVGNILIAVFVFHLTLTPPFNEEEWNENQEAYTTKTLRRLMVSFLWAFAGLVLLIVGVEVNRRG